MSATDELRRLLDERGVGHLDFGGMTEWTNLDNRICRAYTRPEPLTVDVAMFAVLPEQAIAATLGGGECELTMNGTDGNFGCSECLENIPPLASFCPNCGKRIRRAMKQ